MKYLPKYQDHCVIIRTHVTSKNHSQLWFWIMSYFDKKKVEGMITVLQRYPLSMYFGSAVVEQKLFSDFDEFLHYHDALQTNLVKSLWGELPVLEGKK